MPATLLSPRVNPVLASASIHPLFRGALLAIISMLLVVHAHAGPWPRQPGSGVAAVSASFLTAEKLVDAQGDERDYGATEVGFNAYGEVGLARHWALGFSMTPFKAVESDSIDAQGWSDLELNLTRHLFRSGRAVFALRVGGAVPLGNRNSDDAPDFLPALLAQDAWAAEIMPQWGYGAGGGWYQGGLGLRVRGDDRVAQFRYQLMGGRRFGATKTWGARLAFSGVVPLESASNGLPSDQEQYFGFQIATDARLTQALGAFLQLDGMLGPPQEQWFGGRLNLGLTYGWE